MRHVASVPVLMLLLTTGLSAQTLQPGSHHPNWTTSSCNGHFGNTNNFSLFGPKVRVCELRRVTLPLNDPLNVQNTNGGIEVYGQERNTVELEARVLVDAGSRSEAESVEHQIEITTNGVIHADGPRTGLMRPNWFVNYRLYVPNNIGATLHTENGGIDLHHLNGTLQAGTTNGGLTIDDLSGNVRARSVNGGISVTLHGDQWQGGGLTAQTTNGGIHVTAPGNYSAHLIAQTVNGGVSVDLPTSDRNSQHNHFDGNIGHGGATIQLHSVNGGISVSGN